MDELLGQRRSFGFGRELMADLMAVSRSFPLVAVKRTMDLARVAAARRQHPAPPPWSGIFIKAFAIIARDMPVLRQAYFSVPFPSLFQYAENSGSIAFEAEVEGEKTVLAVRIRQPESFPLEAFRWKIEEMNDPKLWESGFWRTVALVGRLPVILRRLVWRLALNIPRFRKRCFGTFGLTTVAQMGAESVFARGPVTSLLSYGPFDPHDRLNVFLYFDHRVYDGATAARVLAQLETVLTGAIVEELAAANRGTEDACVASPAK